MAAAAVSLAPSGGCVDSRDVIALPDRAPLHTVVFDNRYARARAFAADAASKGIRTTGIDGDVTALWLRDLRFHWSADGPAVAGMTTARSLLCLEQMAHDSWRRVLARVEYRPSRSTAATPLVSWIIGA